MNFLSSGGWALLILMNLRSRKNRNEWEKELFEFCAEKLAGLLWSNTRIKNARCKALKSDQKAQKNLLWKSGQRYEKVVRFYSKNFLGKYFGMFDQNLFHNIC